MRDPGNATAIRGSIPLYVLLGMLVSWLIVQNTAMLILWSWPVVPPLLAVVRALLKVAGIVAVQLAPAVLLAAGVGLLWAAARRGTPPAGRPLGEARHV